MAITQMVSHDFNFPTENIRTDVAKKKKGAKRIKLENYLYLNKERVSASFYAIKTKKKTKSRLVP